MRLSKLTLILIPFIYSHSACFAEQTNWELLNEEDGIKVFKKIEDDSGLVSFRGEAVINAKPRDILKMMGKDELAPEWMPLVAERRVIGERARFSRVEYTHIDMPWPCTDRYFVNRSKVNYDEKFHNIQIVTQSVKEHKHIEEDKVLGFLHRSEITLTLREDGRTSARVEINSDPKGLIPKWLVNLGQRSWPVKFFQGMRRMTEKPNVAH